MDAVLQFITANTTLVWIGTVTGLIWKFGGHWKPIAFLSKLPNWIIPWLNAAIVFFGAWAVPTAEAGFLGDVVHKLGTVGKLTLAASVSVMQMAFYEAFIRGPLAALGAKKPAG